MKDCVALTTIVEKKMVKTVQNSCDYDGCVCCFVCNQQKERKTTKINNSNTLKQATALTTGYSIWNGTTSMDINNRVNGHKWW